VSFIEIKRTLSRLSARERRDIQIYLHQLKRTTPAWKKSTAKKIEDVKAGKFATLVDLEVLHRRG